LLLFGTDAFAFGAAGHEAVCEIAYRELTATAKTHVDALIAAESDSQIGTFRDSCVWPDFPGAQQQARRPEHYINIPRYWTSIFYRRCHQVPTCLFTAIDSDIDVLANQFSSTHEKLTALKFLGHWVGDIHQPLHVSYQDDARGNHILVSGVSGCSNMGETKLHAVWDTCIPQDIMQALGASNVAPGDDDREAFGMLLCGIRSRANSERHGSRRSRHLIGPMNLSQSLGNPKWGIASSPVQCVAIPKTAMNTSPTFTTKMRVGASSMHRAVTKTPSDQRKRNACKWLGFGLVRFSINYWGTEPQIVGATTSRPASNVRLSRLQ
jgi:hypothetical protein